MNRYWPVLFFVFCSAQSHADDAAIILDTPVNRLYNVGAEIARQGCGKTISVDTALAKDEAGTVVGKRVKTTCQGKVLRHYQPAHSKSATRTLTGLRLFAKDSRLPKYAQIGSPQSAIEMELGAPAAFEIPSEILKDIGAEKASAIFYIVPAEGPDSSVIVMSFRDGHLVNIYWSF